MSYHNMQSKPSVHIYQMCTISETLLWNGRSLPAENGANPGLNDNQNSDKSHIHQDHFKETTREIHAPPSEDQVERFP